MDFEVTDRLPTTAALIPLFIRIKKSIFRPQNTKKIVYDEDKAIIGAVKSVFPEVVHSFCVFHQLKNVSKNFSDEFKSVKKIPDDDTLVYDEICDLIRYDTVINLFVCYQNILESDSNLELSKASHKASSYAKEIFKKNISFLEKNFALERYKWKYFFL